MADETEKVDKVEKQAAPVSKPVEKAKPDSKPVEKDKPAAKVEEKPVEKAKPAANVEVKADEKDKPAAKVEVKSDEKAAPAAKVEVKSDDKAEATTTASPDPMAEGEEPAVKKIRAKGARVAPTGIAHIRSTFNNTMVCITDMRGGVVAWSSAGKAGFKGSRKNTAFAATMVGQDAARTASSKGMHEVEVRVQGAGAGRESAIRAIQASGMTVSMIKDITPIPHNGCRPKKRRRV
jgi:small subunit ribosomal protein S11